MGTNGLLPKLKRRVVQIAKLLTIVAVLGGTIYWLKFSPLPVTEHPVELGQIVAEVMGTGTLEAHFKSTISPRISGRLQEVLVDMGDVVTAGKVTVYFRLGLASRRATQERRQWQGDVSRGERAQTLLKSPRIMGEQDVRCGESSATLDNGITKQQHGVTKGTVPPGDLHAVRVVPSETAKSPPRTSGLLLPVSRSA